MVSENLKTYLNTLLNVPMEQWHGKVRTTAMSANSSGQVNSFLAVVRGRKYYGFRKHEFVNGVFTGKQWFELERA